MERKRSIAEFKRAEGIFPGGVNSPVRAFKSVGGNPLFIAKAKGAYVFDVDGNRFVDYVNSWGPAIVGHARDEVVEAVQQQAARGLSYGAPTVEESELGELIRNAIPSIDKLRFVSSGTEACMSALRLARAYTKRPKILKFEGCYHGHADMLLVKAGSGVATFGLPDSPGVPKGAAQETLTCPYNNSENLENVFSETGQDIAAVILEPICGNCGFIRPEQEFLKKIRSLCDKVGALLIYDEVMTGFRVAWGGAQVLQDIRPDLTTLGKVIGGGMPLAAFGGRADIMDLLAPSGPVYQAGTLSGNPLAVVAGRKTLEILSAPDSYNRLGKLAHLLTQGLAERAAKYGLPFQVDYEGGMFGFVFSSQPARSLADVQKSDISRFVQFFNQMLDRGIYLAPSAYEAGFVTLEHSEQDIEVTLAAADDVMKGL